MIFISFLPAFRFFWNCKYCKFEEFFARYLHSGAEKHILNITTNKSRHIWSLAVAQAVAIVHQIYICLRPRLLRDLDWVTAFWSFYSPARHQEKEEL